MREAVLSQEGIHHQHSARSTNVGEMDGPHESGSHLEFGLGESELDCLKEEVEERVDQPKESQEVEAYHRERSKAVILYKYVGIEHQDHEVEESGDRDQRTSKMAEVLQDKNGEFLRWFLNLVPSDTSDEQSRTQLDDHGHTGSKQIPGKEGELICFCFLNESANDCDEEEVECERV